MNTAEDPVDALLREQNAYVDDGGFTARVVKSLPRRRRARLRQAVLLATCGIGSVLAIYWLPWGNLPALDVSALLTPDSQMLPPWILVVSVVGSLIWCLTAAMMVED